MRRSGSPSAFGKAYAYELGPRGHARHGGVGAAGEGAAVATSAGTVPPLAGRVGCYSGKTATGMENS
jgi:hypothetical protein